MRKSGARAGAVEAGTVDLARLLLLEFSLVYGNDFFLIPVDLAVGSVFRVRSLVVQDTFGVRTLIRHSSDSDPPLGRFDWTQVIDLTTGQEQPHVYNGERVRLPARTRARYAVEGRLKESETGRRVFRQVKHALSRRP